MKRLLVILLVLTTWLCLPFTVEATTSVTVTITATGIVVGSPGGFTVYYISDYEVGISWTKPPGAVNTMVRAKYGSPPTNRTDGYLIYYGPAELVSDTAVDLENTASEIFYRAWSEDALGVWSDYAQDTMEAIGMIMLAFVVLAVIPTIAAVFAKQEFLAWIGVLGWLILGVYSYTKSTGPWDIYYGLFFVSLFIACVAGFGGYQVRKQKITMITPQGKTASATITEEDEDSAFLEEESGETNKQLEKAQSKRKKRPYRRPW